MEIDGFLLSINVNAVSTGDAGCHSMTMDSDRWTPIRLQRGTRSTLDESGYSVFACCFILHYFALFVLVAGCLAGWPAGWLAG